MKEKFFSYNEMIMGVSNPTSNKNRIEYIDCMRGVSMFFVVYAHIIFFDCFAHNAVTPISGVLGSVKMSLFFFVSGFLAYKSQVDALWLKEKCRNRLLKQFIPTIVIGLTFMAYTKIRTFDEFIFGTTHAGYWFTLTLFEVFLLYALTAFGLEKFKLSRRTKTIVYAVIAVASLALYRLIHSSLPAVVAVVESSAWKVIGVRMILRYTSFFLLGVVAKMHLQRFLQMVENKYIPTLALLCFIVLMYIKKTYMGFWPQLLPGYFGLFAAYAIFHRFRHVFNTGTRVGVVLSYVGQRTLPIYLLHYFCLEGLWCLNGTVLAEFIINSWVIELVVVSLLTAVSIGVCLLVERMTSVFKPLYSLAFGPEK